jgi:hypothetical protein
MNAENLSAPASRHVGHGIGEAHGRASSSPCRRSSFSPACHRPQRHHHPHKSCCSLSASQATPHNPTRRPSTLFPKPPASRSPSPHSTIHSLSVNSPPRLQNNPQTQILCIGSRRAAAELRPSATQLLRGNHNAAERLQRAHRRGRHGDAAPTPSALPSLLLVSCVFSVRTSAEPPLAL